MASMILKVALLAVLAISLEVECFPTDEQIQRISPGPGGFIKPVAPAPVAPVAQQASNYDLKTDSSYGYGYIYPYSYSYYYPRSYYSSYGYGYGYPYHSYYSPYYSWPYFR